MSGWPGDFVTPARARLMRVDVDLERMDAVRAGELQLTSGGCLPIGPLAPYPGVRPARASTAEAADRCAECGHTADDHDAAEFGGGCGICGDCPGYRYGRQGGLW